MKSPKVIEKQEGVQAMAHHNTVFSQLLKLVPRHEFETLATQHHEGRKLRKMTRWSQFVAMTLAQLSGRSSLRDVVSNLSAQASKLYHLGSAIVSRSSLARVNEKQPYTLYERLANVRRALLATASASRTSSTRLMLPLSTSASTSFPGPSSAQPKEQ
jgi:putative transposase